MDVKIMKCTVACMNSKGSGAVFQNEKHKARVFNPMAKEKTYRCTICGAENSQASEPKK